MTPLQIWMSQIPSDEPFHGIMDFGTPGDATGLAYNGSKDAPSEAWATAGGSTAGQEGV